MPDDLIQVLSELNCNYNQFGIGNASGTINVVAALGVTGVVVSDDGLSDLVCVAGDPDPNNNPTLTEFCDNGLDSTCDNPGQPGTGDCAPVPDGLADPVKSPTCRSSCRTAPPTGRPARQRGSPT